MEDFQLLVNSARLHFELQAPHIYSVHVYWYINFVILTERSLIFFVWTYYRKRPCISRIRR